MFHRWTKLAPATLLLGFSLLAGLPVSSSGSLVQNQNSQLSTPLVSQYQFTVVNSWMHDTKAFTQGLVFHEGFLYESTGLTGQSSLRKVDLETGQVLLKVDVPTPHFAEGMTIFQNKIYQLTWLSQVGFVYDLQTFRKEAEFKYTGEGWGLTHDDRHLIMSDGTSVIRFLDPNDFSIKKTINVTERNRPIRNINELEYVNGEIFANIWQTDRIVRIDPETGHVTGVINMTGLLPPQLRTSQTDVLNGIAFDKSTERLFVTGKLWPRIFEVKLKNKVINRINKER